VTTTIKERLHRRVGNMAFEVFFILSIVNDSGLHESLDNMFFFGYMSNIFLLKLISNVMSKFSNVDMWMATIRRCVFLN
jgi:hypothetical protein